MAENIVRCKRCYEVFDAAAGPCLKCGWEYKPVAATPPPSGATYAEMYYGQAEPETGASPAVVRAQERNYLGLAMAAGVSLICLGLVFGGLFAMGAFNGSNDPPAVFVSLDPWTPPPPSPTPPADVTRVMGFLNDKDLAAAVVAQSRVDVSSKVLGQVHAGTVSFDGVVYKGDESGILKQNATTRELRVFDGTVYLRTPPSTSWSVLPVMAQYLLLAPFFGIANPKMLDVVGQEERAGQAVEHFRATRWWAPDLSRMCMMDPSQFGIAPDVVVLDIWAAPDGTPVYASFSGTNTSVDGTKLLDIETTWTFSDVGNVDPIPDPMASPSPSASASASANP
jgi:hypothetical protein